MESQIFRWDYSSERWVTLLLFRQDAVEASLSRRFLLNQWEKASVDNLTTVIRAMQDLEEIIDDVPAAIASC